MSEIAPIPKVSDMVPSIIRTVVPMFVGWIGSLLVLIGVTLTEGQRDVLTGLLTAVLGALYYIAARWAEQRWPSLGWLLGSSKQPTYTNAKTVQGEVVPSPVAEADVDEDGPMEYATGPEPTADDAVLED